MKVKRVKVPNLCFWHFEKIAELLCVYEICAFPKWYCELTCYFVYRSPFKMK